MSKDRLLSDEELRKSIEEIIKTDDYSHGVQMRTIDKMQKLIDTQKRLYAESVIGGDDVLTYPTYPVRLKERNELRAEQRERLK
jgi:hypothetical protein